VEQRGQPDDALGPRLLHHRDGVGEDVLVAVDRVLLEGEGGQLRQELLGQAGVDEEPQARARGGTTTSLSSSMRMRSGDTISSRSCMARTAATRASSGSSP
jgi:hypothetical protein